MPSFPTPARRRARRPPSPPPPAPPRTAATPTPPRPLPLLSRRAPRRLARRLARRVPRPLSPSAPREPSSAAEEAVAAAPVRRHGQLAAPPAGGAPVDAGSGPGEGVVLEARAGRVRVRAGGAGGRGGEGLATLRGRGGRGDGDRWDGRGFLAAVRGLNVRVRSFPVSFTLSFLPLMHRQVALTINTDSRSASCLRHATARGAPFRRPAARPARAVGSLPDVAALPRCRKHQFAAFVARARRGSSCGTHARRRSSGRAEELEKALIAVAWGQEEVEGDDAGEAGGGRGRRRRMRWRGRRRGRGWWRGRSAGMWRRRWRRRGGSC